MREHARDPQFMTHAIRHGSASSEMRWDRWSDWKRSDRRWRVRIIDTSNLAVARVADEIAPWIDDERPLLGGGEHPLTHSAYE